jgi:tRNA U34 5-carboxymethylaminomethyl modifying GTPase MnmE/TrmE
VLHSPDPDTIAAISTPPGRGGIGIVRLAGPDALTIAARLLHLNTPLHDPHLHAHARRARVLDPADPTRTLDDALVTVFHAPRSYTGDTLIEIAAHGSPVVLDTLLRAALALGARLATPGQFTQRAFLSGRLDLTQAEAVHDLIAAQTLDQVRVAAQQLGGALARQLATPKGTLLHLIALLEAGMDFASGELDDVDLVPPSAIAASILEAHAPLAALAATFRRGQLLRNGAAIALIGPPNAGKSSLFNRLLERDRAIVTPIPGTTRDTLEETLSLNGIPLRLIDTAGLRNNQPATTPGAPFMPPHLGHERETTPLDEAESQGIARTHEALAGAPFMPPHLGHERDTTAIDEAESQGIARTYEALAGAPFMPPHLGHERDTTAIDEAESQGIARTHEALADANLILLIHDATQPLTHAEQSLAATLQDRPHLIIHNKLDLLPPDPLSSRPESARSGVPIGRSLPEWRGWANAAERPAPEPPQPPVPILTSALTGHGIDDLRAAILSKLNAAGSLADTALLNNLRQHEHLTDALEALDAATHANAAALPHEVLLLDLHAALRSLDALTGTTTPDDILARIFSTFCIGK